MAFPTSNLPSASMPWGREVEKQVSSLASSVASNNVNNTARDNQLASSYKRLDTTVNQVAVVASQAQEAIDAITGLGVPGSGTIVNASNIQGGTITGITMTGNTINSAASGARVEISGTSLRIDGGSGTVATLYGSGSSFFLAGTGGSIDVDGGGTSIHGGGSSIDVLSSGIVVSGNTSFVDNVNFSSPVDFIDAVDFTTSPTFTGASFSSSISTSGIVNTGGISNTTGNINSPGTYANTSASGRVMYVASNGTYNCSTSSARYKQDITPYVVDVNKIMQLEPVSFRYKKAVEESGDSADVAHGFIAEQATEIGLTEFVDFEPDESGNLRPDNFRYIDFTAALHSVIKQQQSMIESLTARIEALEGKV